MIDFRYIFVFGLLADMGTRSMIPVLVIFTLAFILRRFRPQWFKKESFRLGGCIQTAIVVLLLLPYALVFTPGGGEEEQRWLDAVITHLEEKRDVCTDPEMKEIIDYTIRRYHRIGAFGVRVVQLPEDVLGVNSPFCPGITLDESLTEYHVVEGAAVLVHEAMHDYWPHFGHTHIDDERIWNHIGFNP
jgi:hypothetical protein